MTVEDDFIRDAHQEVFYLVEKRLGIRAPPVEEERVVVVSDESESESSSEEENWCKRSKIPQMRMHADDEEKKQLQKIRSKLK